jgi:hypothetical protein
MHSWLAMMTPGQATALGVGPYSGAFTSQMPMQLPSPLSTSAAALAAAAEEAADKKGAEERRPWTREEDVQVLELVKKHGTKK